MPKDFITAHDSAITNLSNQKLEKEYEKIKNLLPQMHQKYDFSNDKYLIKAPDSGRDITYEGQALHHCVSGYVSWVADQKTVILFLRKQKEPNKPFVTIEVRNNKIIQVRGFSNHNPEPEVLDFVEEFKNQKHIA